MLKEVIATRYITPLREGGSLPGLVEADDLGAYAMKFTGAGQGRKTLVAEVICGQLARRLGLRVPDLLTVRLDPVIGLGEPDIEVQELLKSSGGPNLGVAFLSGALGFDALAYTVDPVEAGRVVWFDALVNNVDRSWRNPNMLVWHGDLWLIDHGATMIWHHNWPTATASAAKPYDASDHALAPFGPDVATAAAELAPLVTEDLLTEAAADVPDAWLVDEAGFDSADAVRHAYVAALLPRARTIHERITLGPRDAVLAARPTGWFTADNKGDNRGDDKDDDKGGTGGVGDSKGDNKGEAR
ncbi:HipA family kinase [Streptomyces sp. NPDC058001]|uniref:HipA family kinase n=1 Tax=Streptomyces sp. NPDC058001 TaxID=3346300 RepID=UPI0036E86733